MAILGRVLRASVRRPVRAGVAIRAAHYGDEAGMMGAALLAFDHVAEATA